MRLQQARRLNHERSGSTRSGRVPTGVFSCEGGSITQLVTAYFFIFCFLAERNSPRNVLPAFRFQPSCDAVRSGPLLAPQSAIVGHQPNETCIGIEVTAL